jgi:ubiquinone/menaquinone biosynthesis C-methylase UbiE
MRIIDWLICPDCKAPLKFNKGVIVCKKCKKKFKEKNGVLSLSSSSVKYEWPKIELPIVLEDRSRRYRDFKEIFEKNKEIFHGNILEIGASICMISATIKKNVSAATVIATDVARNILEAAVKITPIIGGKPDFFIQCNAEQLPFKDGLFDCVIGSSVLHHTELSKSMSEISRVLKKGGFYVGLREPLSSFLAKPIYRKHLCRRSSTKIYTVPQYRKILRENKFEDIKISFYKNPRLMNPGLSDQLYYTLIKSLPNFLLENFLFGRARIIARKG